MNSKDIEILNGSKSNLTKLSPDSHENMVDIYNSSNEYFESVDVF